jgi:hypothetical protein
VAGDPLIGASPEPLASCDAAFSCLLQLGGQSGGSEVGGVNGRNVVNGETLSISRLIELAGDLGIKAEPARLDWQRLQTPEFGYPALALLKNTNVVVLTGRGRDGSAEVAVWDPLNRCEEILFVSRENFQRVWTGHLLIITAAKSNRAVMSACSDICWFTSAGIELLRKTSANAQNSKLSVHRGEKTSTNSTAAPKIMRPSDRAMAPVMRGEPALARVEIADERPPRDSADAARLPTPVLSRRAPARRPSPLVRLCIAACVIVTAAGGGAFLVSNSVTDPVAAAIILAKNVWAVAPNGVQSKGKLVQNATAGSDETAPRIVSAPIPAAESVTPAAMPGRAAPSTERGAAHVEPALPSPAAAPAVSPVAPAPPSPAAAPGAPYVEPAPPGSATAAGAPHTKSVAPAASTNGSRLSAEEMAALLARGDKLLSVGDVASARLFYERAAGAGGGLAATRLGETFDPLFLDRIHLSGVRGDPTAASFWYHRAHDLGATDAEMLLKALETESK